MRERFHQINVNRSYIYALTFTLIIVIALIWKLELYPFGDHYFRYQDGDQYYGFYGYLQSIPFTPNNLFYSWGMTFGGSFLPTFAYYASSPLNLLLFLFRNDLPLGMQVIMLIKAILASLCFCAFLNTHKTGYDLEKGIISASYAFIGYAVFYAWNSSWMDEVVLLPVMVLGLKKLLLKRNPFLYICTLAITIISNYYIGYMVCITSGIFYICYCFDDSGAEDRLSGKLKKSIIPYLWSSFLGVGISMILLAPVYYALPAVRRMTWSQIWQDPSANFNILSFFSMFFTGSVVPGDSSDNLPVVFIGIIPFFLVLMYFINSGISIKKRVVSLVLIGVFVISFQFSPLNIIWHGFSENVYFNYRYSFVLSFIMMFFAFDSVVYMPDNRWILIVSEVLFLIILTASVCFKNPKPNNINVILDVTLSISGMTLIYIMYYVPHKKVAVQYILCLLILLNVIYNSVWAIRDGTDKTSVEEYRLAKARIDEVKRLYDNNTVIRIGDTDPFGRCEASQFDYAGVENYASTETINTLELAEKMGYRHTWMWADFGDNSPASSDDLFGFRYIVSDKAIEGKDYEIIYDDENTCIYYNSNAFPLIFEAAYLADSKEYDNFFEIQNDIYKSIDFDKSIGKNVFERVKSDVDKKTMDTGEYDIMISIPETESDVIYLQLLKGVKKGSIIQTDTTDRSIEIDNTQRVFYIDKAGSDGTIKVHLLTSTDLEFSQIAVYRQRDEVLKQYHEQQQLHSNYEIIEKSSSHLKLITHNETKTDYMSTIPYDAAWRVYVDGNRIPTENDFGYFLSFEVPEGEHKLDLVYIPAGFWRGAVISGLSLLMVAIELIIWRRQKKGILTHAGNSLCNVLFGY